MDSKPNSVKSFLIFTSIILFFNDVHAQCGDTVDPTASNPIPIIVNCAFDVPSPDPNVVTDEADNSGVLPMVAFVSDVSDGNVCAGEIITRTYSIADTCGNIIYVEQTIIISVSTPTVDAGPDQSICEGIPVTLTAYNPDGAMV